MPGRIKRHIRIIGHDNIPQASWDAYALTTLAQQCDVQAHHAIDMLTSRIADPEREARPSVIDVTLLERRSG